MSLTTMLKAQELEELGNPIADLLPWLTKLDETRILCKDGSIFCTFEITGQDKTGKEKFETDSYYNTMDRAYKSIADEKIMVWWNVLKRKTNFVPRGKYNNKFSQMVEDDYYRTIQNYNKYIYRHYITILIKPPIGNGRYIDNYVRNINNGASMLEALRFTVKQALNSKERGIIETTEIMNQMALLEESCNLFIGAASTCLDFKPIKNDHLSAFLAELSSPATPRAKEIKTSYQAYLDDYLPSNTIDVNGDHLDFSGPLQDKYISMFSPKLMPEDWPQYSEPGMLDAIYMVDAELNITMSLKMVSPLMAKKFANRTRKHHIDLQKSLFTLAKEAISKKNLDEEINKERQKYVAEIEKAIDDMSYNPASAFVNFSVALICNSHNELIEANKSMVKAMNTSNLTPFKETTHLLSAWAGTLPGQWMQSLRWAFLIGGNLSDLSPIITKNVGSRNNKHLTYFFKTNAPSLALYMDNEGSPFYFNYHIDDLGHTLVIGPSRAGKSIFNTLNITFWQKYQNQQIIIFDKDNTCRIMTKLEGGEYLDPLLDFTLNPFKHAKTDDDWKWIFQWVISYLFESNDQPKIGPEEAKAIESAFSGLKALQEAGSPVKLINLSALLPQSLKIRLDPWIGNGQHSKYFDNYEDSFNLTDFVTIEMNKIMQNQEVSEAFMSYAFWRISNWLSGSKPTLIYIEECWFLLRNKKFTDYLEDWLKTLSKKEAIVVLATQSLAEISNSSISASILDNIQTRIYLPNAAVYNNIDLYKDVLGLNNSTIELIRTSVRKREYILWTPDYVKVLNIPLSKKTLSVLRSDKLAQTTFTKWENSGVPDWREKYVEEMSSA